MSNMAQVNIKTAKKCAFCKNWYDPANSAIAPKTPSMNIWQYDMDAKKMCLKKNLDMKATAFCSRYECKI